MTPLLDAEQARKDAGTAYAAMRAHRHTEAYSDVLHWIDSLIAQHQAHMTACKPDALPLHQIRIAQLVALRSAMVGGGGASTGFVF